MEPVTDMSNKMNGFLKRHWFNIILSLALISLFFYLIPGQEKFYLEPDIKIAKSKSHTALIVVGIVLVGLGLILGLRQLRKFKDILICLMYFAVFFWMFYLVFQPFFLYGTLLLNRAGTNESIKKKYRVFYYEDNKKDLLLYDFHLKKGFSSNKLAKTNDSLKIATNDIITISFNKGLLGINCNPKITAD